MDKVYYYNRKGTLRLTINEAPYYMELGTGEFKDHNWDYEEQYGTLRSFRRDKGTYPFNVIINSRNDADFDALCDIFNEDVIAGKPGYLLINGWKLECFVVTAKHQFYGRRDNVISFTAVAIDSTWTRSVTKHYNGTAGGGSDEDYGRNYSYSAGRLGRGYNYGYEEYAAHSASLALMGTENGFEALIYGPVINPTIYINNEPVKVNVTVGENERLRIVSNGSVRTIEILQLDGTSESAFVYRDKEHSPFLTLGSQVELAFGDIEFDFTSIERRSEPSWT